MCEEKMNGPVGDAEYFDVGIIQTFNFRFWALF